MPNNDRVSSRAAARWNPLQAGYVPARFKRIALLLIVLIVAALLSTWWLLRGSLPVLDGEVTLPGLSAPVTVARDALGTITIDAANEADAMRALGYVHAQERYFEMDLMRRNAAGELAGLFGPVALDIDKQLRVHRMRARVTRNLDAIAGDRMPQLRAYADGVNAGLAELRVRPWSYLLLGQSPQPWRVEDAALVGYMMYFDLQDSRGERELALWRIGRHLPPVLFALLTHGGSRWEAPLTGDARGAAVLPGPAQLDLRKLPMPEQSTAFIFEDKPFVGSNNFAVSGALTSDGRAIVADDMHLGLRAPNIWFRARLRYPDPRAPEGKVDVQGFTLPGLPAVIVGSNGHVAWGFTNSYVDTADWARVMPCKSTQDAPPDCARVTTHRESIRVAGEPAVAFDVEETAWGPIMARESDGAALALRWTAHLRGSLNFGLGDLAHAANLAQALAVADNTAIPTQNLVVADSTGNIAWRLLGPLPQREGGCSTQRMIENTTRPADDDDSAAPFAQSSEVCAPWRISTSTAPALVNPSNGRLWTANNRVVDLNALQHLGDAGYDLGARAQQIRDGLSTKQNFTERDLLAIQLDDRALFLQRWWQLLNDAAARARSPALRALGNASKTWQDRADTDATSYRIVRAWRLAVHARIADGLTAPAQLALGEDFEMPNLRQLEGVVWPLVTQRPMHLLPRRFESWNALLEDAAAEVRDELAPHGPLAQRRWGERNTAHICHPLASALPGFAERALCMPPDPLPGDSHMPRVQAPDTGASQRMVVSPGREADGIAHMPGGQSGHPLSPFWGAGHDDWVHGRPTPFLPGEMQYTLRLTPP